MKKKPRLTVISESASGRNETFRDNRTGQSLTRKQLAQAIENGKYPDYHVRNINGIDTPCSNPDKSEGNNLG